jgi:glycosyltransferase involved in cell wall biosynthesis
MPRKSVAFLSPLLPLKTGIAHYASMLLPALADICDVTAVVSQAEVDPAPVPVIPFDEFRRRASEFDGVICALGNNPYHSWIYRWARENPSVIVLHDFVLHHLLVEMTLRNGDAEGFRREIALNHGDAGLAIATAREAGIHGEIANFLFPASIEIARVSKAVIVHNEYAASQLRSFGVSTPIVVAGHPYVENARPESGVIADARARLGWQSATIIGMFGFVTQSKRPESVFEAFAIARGHSSDLKLLVVGEAAENVDLPALAARFELPADSWRSLGYVSESDFDLYLGVVDRVVNLRYPTAGETSGPLIRAIAAMKPIAVNRFAQFADLPDGVATKIDFDDEINQLAAFMSGERSTDLAEAKREWIRRETDVRETAAAYLRAIDASDGDRASDREQRVAPLPLFPNVRIAASITSRSPLVVRCDVRNEGTDPLLSNMFGFPGYRLVVKGVSNFREVESHGVRLPRDLRAGESVSVEVRFNSACERVLIVEALDGIGVVDSTPRAEVEVS